MSDLSVSDIGSGIAGTVGSRIFFREAIDSTNNLAVQLAVEGLPEGTAVIADSQSRGRGRHGREWLSPPGVNIYFSILLRPDITPTSAFLITFMSAVSCASALRKTTGQDIRIKWPNDLVFKDKKLGGILTETKTSHDKILFAVTGTGINVNMRANDFPDYLQDSSTSLLNETGICYSRAPIIRDILNEMDIRYSILKSSGRDRILAEWKELSSTLGRKVLVKTDTGQTEGLAEAIDDNGLLILRLATGQIEKVHSGIICPL